MAIIHNIYVFIINIFIFDIFSMEKRKHKMIDINKKMNMIISEIIPGFVLSLDLLMLIDNLSNKMAREIVSNSYLFLTMIFVSSIIMGFFLLNVSFFVFEPIARYLSENILKLKRLNDYWLITIRTFFFNMIIPLIILGFVFPDFILAPMLHPYFIYLMCFMSFISFIFGLLQGKIQEKYGTYYCGE
jgi:hypothetical protein